LELQLQTAIRDDLFRQRNVLAGDEGGLARTLFRELSKYTHGGPNYTDADLWKSNGPVIVHTVFELWVHMFALVLAIGLLEIQIARPNLTPECSDRRKLKELFSSALAVLVIGSDERRILEAAALLLWTEP